MENMVGKKVRKKPNRKRDHGFTLRLTDDEYNMVEDLSNMLNMSKNNTIMHAVRWVYNILSFRNKK